MARLILTENGLEAFLVALSLAIRDVETPTVGDSPERLFRDHLRAHAELLIRHTAEPKISDQDIAVVRGLLNRVEDLADDPGLDRLRTLHSIRRLRDGDLLNLD